MSVENKETAKYLNTRISVYKSKIHSKEQELSESRKELNDLKETLCKLNKKLESLSKENVEISEHAILRYLERVKGINIVEIRKEIVSEKNFNAIKTLSNGKFPENGYKLVVKDNTIVTIET